jgi:precorrin-6Y C5,15-methyltransferase (decarboxylating)
MQLAFARVKESWDEAYLANLDVVSLARALDRIRVCEKAGLFTTEAISPAQIARHMLDRGIDYFTVYVCENLGSPDERVTRGELNEIAQTRFAPLNIVILVRKPVLPDRPAATFSWRPFGYPDECYQQSLPKRGLLTPMEVRVLALAALQLQPDGVVWDVGAGSGSVSIEAALIAHQGTVYAIEMDVEDLQLIKANCRRIGVDNVIPVLGQAPEVWNDLPDPNAIFVGGTGRRVAGIATAAWQRLLPHGQLVINTNSVDNLVDLSRALRQISVDFDVRMVQVSEGVDQMESIRFESRHPTYLVHARKNLHPA